jgi:hypothetical protein
MGLVGKIQIIAFFYELNVVVRAPLGDDGAEKANFSNTAGQHFHDAQTDDGLPAARGHRGDIKVVCHRGYRLIRREI